MTVSPSDPVTPMIMTNSPDTFHHHPMLPVKPSGDFCHVFSSWSFHISHPKWQELILVIPDLSRCTVGQICQTAEVEMLRMCDMSHHHCAWACASLKLSLAKPLWAHGVNPTHGSHQDHAAGTHFAHDKPCVKISLQFTHVQTWEPSMRRDEESSSPLTNASNVTFTLGFHELFMNPTHFFFKRHQDFALVLFHGLSSHATTQESEFSGCAMIWVDATLSHSGPTTNSPTFHSKTFPITVSLTSLPTSLKDWFHVGQKTRPFQTSASSQGLRVQTPVRTPGAFRAARNHSWSLRAMRCLGCGTSPTLPPAPAPAAAATTTTTTTQQPSNPASKQASKQPQQQPSNQASKQQRLHLRPCRGQRQLLNVNCNMIVYTISHITTSWFYLDSYTAFFSVAHLLAGHPESNKGFRIFPSKSPDTEAQTPSTSGGRTRKDLLSKGWGRSR